MRDAGIFFFIVAVLFYTFAPNTLHKIQTEVKNNLSPLNEEKENKVEKNVSTFIEENHNKNLKNENSSGSSNENGVVVYNATYLYTVDGDTIAVNFEGKEERVRFLMMNTPETKNVATPEPFGPEASAFTKNFFNGATDIKLEFDTQKRDPHGRLLAYVYLNNVMINEELLKQGLAEVTIYAPNDKYEDRFYKIQNEAIKNKLGLWSQ